MTKKVVSIKEIEEMMARETGKKTRSPKVEVERVSAHEAIRKGDWAIVYSPNMEDGKGGFSLLSPKNPLNKDNRAPLGGVVLAAVMFLLEHENTDFWKHLIDRANAVAKRQFGGPMFGDPDDASEPDTKDMKH